VGIDKRDHVWDHPDLLPSAEHLDNPAAFIDGLLDDNPSDDFDAEFAKLEEMLRNGDSGASEDAELDKSDKDSQKETDESDNTEKRDDDSGESDSDSDDKYQLVCFSCMTKAREGFQIAFCALCFWCPICPLPKFLRVTGDKGVGELVNDDRIQHIVGYLLQPVGDTNISCG